MKFEELNSTGHSKYCYPNTDVLKNKRDIKDYDQLIEAEKIITTYKLSKLCLNEFPFRQTFDYVHYLNIHKYLFEDIYEFAGTIRDENTYKSNAPYKQGNTHFCDAINILSFLKSTLTDMKADIAYGRVKTNEDLINFFAKYYLELNMAHPFTEGNGRTLREFFREYSLVLSRVLDLGEFKIDYAMDNDTKEMLIKAAIFDDIELSRLVFTKIIKFEEFNNTLKVR